MRKAALVASSVATAVLAQGCATLSAQRGHDDVARLVAQRTGGAQTRWGEGPPEDGQVAAHVQRLLEGGLTRQRAVEVALINNRTLQATYEELGVSQADMVEAGLLENPTLDIELGFPSGGGGLESEVSLVTNFLTLFVLPARRRIAAEQFSADTMRVAHEALEVTAAVSKTVAAAQAAQQAVELRRTAQEALRLSLDIVELQYRAGNVPELTLVSERAAYQQALLELSRSELELLEAREELNRLLGLWGPQTDWTLAEALPALPPQEAGAESLEARAVRQRLDVDAARRQADVLARALSLARNSRLFGFIEVGVHTDKTAEGTRVTGPVLSLELPLFHQRQPLIARLGAQARQAERQLQGLSVQVRSEVRLAYARLVAARATAEHYRDVLLPLRERVVELTQLHYNGMFLGPAALLAAKQAQVEASGNYLETLRAYWQARAELERAVGGQLPTATPQPASRPPASGEAP